MAPKPLKRKPLLQRDLVRRKDISVLQKGQNQDLQVIGASSLGLSEIANETCAKCHAGFYQWDNKQIYVPCLCQREGIVSDVRKEGFVYKQRASTILNEKYLKKPLDK